MHLLIIITDYGSLNNFFSELVVRLVEKGNTVDVICSKDKVINFEDRFDYRGQGINVHFASFPRSFNIYKQYITSIEISRLIKKIKPDLIHIHFTTGIFTTLFYRKPSALTIGTIHGLGSPMMVGMQRTIFKMVERFCFHKLDQIYLLNRFDYQLVKRYYKEKTFLLESAGLGCDLTRFDMRLFESGRESLRTSLGIFPDDFVITFTGRFVYFKGFDLVIKSFLQLNNRFPKQYKLVLIGGNDPVHDTGLSEEQEKDYKSCPEIINIGFTDQVEKFLSVSDVFLFPSLKEGMPVCIMEALAMGIPVITADSRGCNDLVLHQKNGILLSALPDINEVKQAVRLLHDNASLQKDLREYALRHRYLLSRDLYIDKQIQAYTKILEKCK